jgi:hypothetical protein
MALSAVVSKKIVESQCPTLPVYFLYNRTPTAMRWLDEGRRTVADPPQMKIYEKQKLIFFFVSFVVNQFV